MKKIKKIGAMALGKVMGAMYAIIGLIIGGVVTIFSVLGSTFSSSGSIGRGTLFGVGAIIFLPILYGALGFISGVLSGWIFNLVTRWVGGLEIEFEDSNNSKK